MFRSWATCALIVCVTAAQATPPRLINSSNSTLTQIDGGGDIATVIVGAGERVSAVNITTESSYFNTDLMGEGKRWAYVFNESSDNLLEHGILGTTSTTMAPGEYTFFWDRFGSGNYTVDFVFHLPSFEAGQLLGSTTQVQFQNQSYQFQSLSSQVRTMAGSFSGGGSSMDLGRDWALLGVGLQGDRNAALTLYANYDLQVNDRQRFHTGSGGLVWMR